MSAAATSVALFFADVDDEQILHDGVADVAIGIAFGEVGGKIELLRGDAAAQNRSADVDQAGLLLVVDADVVAVDVGGDFFRVRRDRE